MNNQDNEKVFQKNQINWYPGHMAKAKRLINENINLIDIVYEVVDARIPMSSKIIDIDNYIKNKPKILIMNKIDLCDLKETNKWKKYYEEKGYKVLLTSLEKSFNEKELINLTEEILKPLNDKIQEKDMKKRKNRVLVVGVPNAGKSTLINRLAGKKVVSIGNKPGVTKKKQWISINDKINLLDTPGVLWPRFEDEKTALNLAFTGTIKDDVLEQTEIAYQLLKFLLENYRQNVTERYKITLDFIEKKLSQDQPENFNVYEIMQEIGRKRGAIISGGEIDDEKTAKIILDDFRSGRLGKITIEKA